MTRMSFQLIPSVPALLRQHAIYRTNQTMKQSRSGLAHMALGGEYVSILRVNH
jgi:hypothetical protein